MKDKTKEEFIEEIKLLQKRIAELESPDSERKRANEALQENEARLRTVLETVKEGIIFSDEKGYFKVYNSEMERLTGYSKEEANGSGDFIALLYPDPKEGWRARERLGLILRENRAQEFESAIRRKDGQRRDVLVYSVMISYQNRRMFLSTFRDITERKKADKLLKESEERYRLLIQTLPHIVYEVDAEGRFIFVSDGVKGLGYTSEELIGKHFKEIVHPDDFEAVSRFIVLPEYRGRITGAENSPKLFDERRTSGRMTQHLQIRLLRKSQNEAQGDYCYCEIDSAGGWDKPVEDKDKNFLGSIGIIQDITERKKMEEEKMKHLKELEVFYKASVGREERIIELKKEIEILKHEDSK